MKLFKKLAAVAVAAVLALSMVGCGAANAGPSYKTELMNLLKDVASVVGESDAIENTSSMDTAAQVLLKNAQTAYDAQDGSKIVTKTLFVPENEPAKTDLLKAAGLNGKNALVSYMVDQNYASNYFNSMKYMEMLAMMMPGSDEITHKPVARDNQIEIGNLSTLEQTEKVEIGFARDQIGGKTYIVVVMAAAQ